MKTNIRKVGKYLSVQFEIDDIKHDFGLLDKKQSMQILNTLKEISEDFQYTIENTFKYEE